MASKEEKQRRKELLQGFKSQEREYKLAQMPISKTDLKDLFSNLDYHLEKQGCDETLTLTESFLKERGLPADVIKPWLAEYGGYCDCEVLANVESEFDGII